jgi:hypothetical protein
MINLVPKRGDIVNKRNEKQEIEVNEAINPNRRAVLNKLGKFGAYTAPLLLASLDAQKAAACSDPQCV